MSKFRSFRSMISKCSFLYYSLYVFWLCDFATCEHYLPSSIPICQRKDPNLNACLKSSIQKAIPIFTKSPSKFGIKHLDPMDIGRVDMGLTSMSLNFDNTMIYGLGKSKLNFFHLSQKEKVMVVSVTANTTVRSRYKLKGKVVLINYEAEGVSKIKSKNVNMIITFSYDTIKGADKKNHWIITNYTYSQSMEHATFKFSHLFDSLKILHNLAINFLNKEWEYIMQSVAPPMFDLIVGVCVGEIKKIFKKLPLDEMLPDN